MPTKVHLVAAEVARWNRKRKYSRAIIQQMFEEERAAVCRLLCFAFEKPSSPGVSMMASLSDNPKLKVRFSVNHEGHALLLLPGDRPRRGAEPWLHLPHAGLGHPLPAPLRHRPQRRRQVAGNDDPNIQSLQPVRATPRALLAQPAGQGLGGLARARARAVHAGLSRGGASRGHRAARHPPHAGLRLRGGPAVSRRAPSSTCGRTSPSTSVLARLRERSAALAPVTPRLRPGPGAPADCARSTTWSCSQRQRETARLNAYRPPEVSQWVPLSPGAGLGRGGRRGRHRQLRGLERGATGGHSPPARCPR